MAIIMFQCMLIAASAVIISSGANYNSLEKMKILDKILNVQNYDSRVRPPPLDSGTEPVVVRVNTFIRSISDIDDVKMEYSAQITFRQEWNDTRLKYNETESKVKYLTLADTSRVWIPDLFFSNEKNGHFHNIIMPNVRIRIYPDGLILYSIRISLKLSCPMDLRRYPMDRQTCSIMMASYGYTTEDIVFLWKEVNPVRVSKNLALSQFLMEHFWTNYCTSRTNAGEYSCLKLDFLFAREFNYYLLQIYMPSTASVILSWVSFWFNQKATTARISIWITALLTLVIKVSTISEKFPAVSYITSIDVWTGVCFAFLYAVVIELAIVAHAVITEERQRSGNEDVADESSVKKLIVGPGSDGSMKRKPGIFSRFSMFNRMLQRYPTRSHRIDLFARTLFPIAFFLFNLIYWAKYF